MRAPAMPVEKIRAGLLWQLDLYIAGKTPRSALAVANLKKICETHLAGRYLIKVIDLIESPKLGTADQVLVLPMAIRRLPAPIKKIIGDMPNTERVLAGLGIPPIG